MSDLTHEHEQALQMNGAKFNLTIEETKYTWPEQYITLKELLHLAELPENAELYIAVDEPWKDELVTTEHKINLGRPEIERFFVKRDLKLTINEKNYDWHRQFINRKQLVRLGDLDPKNEIFLKILPPGKDELITNESRINLALPGAEHFYSKKAETLVTIIVNGTPQKWDKEEISFKEVIIIAFGNYIDRPTMVYTVAFEDGPNENPEGSMVKGTQVFVKNKMIFHATATDKS